MRKVLFILSLFLLSSTVAPAQLKRSLVKIVKEGREPGMPYKSPLLNNFSRGVYKNESEVWTEKDVKEITQKLGYRVVYMRTIGLSPSWAVGGVKYFPRQFWFVPESEWQKYQSEAGIRERNVVKKINADITANDFSKEGELYFFDQNYGGQKRKVKWTGNVIAGLIEGQGMGYMMTVEGDRRVYYTVKGTFQKGLPVGDVTYAVGNTLDNDADRDVKMSYKHLMNVSSFSDGIAYFTKDHKKYGFLSSDGKLVSKPVYDAVKNDMKNGQFVVTYKKMDIVIDKNGKFLSIADGVTEIPASYFNEERFNDLKSITIPKSVKMIRRGAFSNRKNLCQVTFLGTVSEIEGYAFSYCSSLTSIDLSSFSNNILSFGVFKSCTSLRTVKLPPVITDIGDNTFEGCTSLASISLPAKLTKIWKETFKNCTSLTTITIPNHVESIGDNCFLGCTSLTSIVLPNSVTTIGSKAFSGCKLLSSATLPANLSNTAKGKEIFSECAKLKGVALRNANGTKKQSTDWYWFNYLEPQKPQQPQKSQQAQKSKEPQRTQHLSSTLRHLIANMVHVEGGSFIYRGEEKWVSSFKIGKYEVTQEEWEAVMGKNPSYFKFPDSKKNPVESISWHDCNAFIGKLNKLTGMKFRLLKSLEWYYAARGGNKSRGFLFAGSDLINEVAYWEGNSNKMTHKVGEKKANELGLYDMCGNVWEWCLDYEAGPLNQDEHIVRGGSCLFGYGACKVYDGIQSFSSFATRSDTGLRLALDD